MYSVGAADSSLTNLYRVLYEYNSQFKWLSEQSFLPEVIKKLIFSVFIVK
jgi:hypothetical protein